MQGDMKDMPIKSKERMIGWTYISIQRFCNLWDIHFAKESFVIHVFDYIAMLLFSLYLLM